MDWPSVTRFRLAVQNNVAVTVLCIALAFSTVVNGSVLLFEYWAADSRALMTFELRETRKACLVVRDLLTAKEGIPPP